MVPISRRTSLRAIAAAGAAPLLGATSTSDLTIAGTPVEIQLTRISDRTIRIGVLAIGGEPIPNYGTLTEEQWDAPVATTLRKAASVKVGALTIEVNGSPLTIRVRDRNRLVQTIAVEPKGGFGFDLGNAPVLGLGQGGPGFDRRGQFDRMTSGQGGYELATHGSRVPIQWLVGTGGWAIFVHHPVGAFDMTGQQGRFLPFTPGFPLDLFVVAATEPAAVMAEYARLTGFPEMPPLWSIGYQQSHRTLGSPEQILAEAKEFRRRKLPCDAFIYLGTGFCPNGWNTGNGEFTWNSRAFPDPAGAIRALHADNVKVVLHVVVEGHRMTGRVTDRCTTAPLPSGRTLDGTWPPDRQVACYWPLHKPLADLGIDGWWPDQGDDFDPLSRLARNRMYFEGQQQWRPNKRVYALHRNGFPGMQRFAAFLWSGDVQTRWETLARHVPIAVNTGLSGIPYWGTDIGGFVSVDELSGELYARWFQFGAFNPLFRSHGRDWRMHRPWGWTDGNRGEPESKWAPTPEQLRDARVEPICRQYLELRYRLTPYVYAAVREACDSGMPIIRALWLHHADDSQAVARGDQYLFGRDLLVAPVVEKGAANRKVYLPTGEWWDWWDHSRHAGGREILRNVDLATMPLYARAGAIVPLDPVKQYLAEPTDEPTEILVFPGADGNFTLYEDDGESFDCRRGGYRRTEFVWDDSKRRLHVRPDKDAGGFTEGRSAFILVIAGSSARFPFRYDGSATTIRA